jgi:hypothetical protein
MLVTGDRLGPADRGSGAKCAPPAYPTTRSSSAETCGCIGWPTIARSST